jgi:hypothetical protein
VRRFLSIRFLFLTFGILLPGATFAQTPAETESSESRALISIPPLWLRTTYLPILFESKRDKLREGLEKLKNKKIDPKTRRVEYPLSDLLKPYEESLKKGIDDFSSDPARANKILRDLLGYRAVITFGFAGDPQFKNGSFTATPATEPAQIENSLPVLTQTEFELTMAPRFWPTKLDLTLENPSLPSWKDPTTKELVSLTSDPSSFIPSETQFQLPEVKINLRASIHDNLAATSVDIEKNDPLIIKKQSLTTNLRDIQLNEKEIDTLVANTFTKQHIKEVVEGVLSTRVFHEGLIQFQKDAEAILKKQKIKLTFWIERNGPHDYKAHIKPSVTAEKELARLKANNQLLYQAEAEVSANQVHDLKLSVGWLGAAGSFQIPEDITLTLKPIVSKLTKEVIGDFKEERLRKILQSFSDLNLVREGAEINIDLHFPSTKAEAALPLRWDESGIPSIDLAHMKIDLPFLDDPLKAIQKIHAKVSKETPEIVIDPNSSVPVAKQLLYQQDALLKSARFLTKDQVLRDAEAVITEKIETSVNEIGNPHPREVHLENRTIGVQIQEFHLPPHALTIDWDKKTTDDEHFRQTDPLGLASFKKEFIRPPGYPALKEFLPTPYLRFGTPKDPLKSYQAFGKSKLLEERWVTLRLPPQIQFRLENVTSESGDYLSFVEVKMRSTEKEGPLVHVKVRVMEDWQTGMQFLDFDKDNLAAVVHSYNVGTAPEDLAFGKIAPSGIAGRLTGAAEAGGLLLSSHISKDEGYFGLLRTIAGSTVSASIGQLKIDQAREKVIEELSKSKVALYRMIAEQVMKAVNGSIPSTLGNPAGFEARIRNDPPYDPSDRGILTQIYTGVDETANEILASVPKGEEVRTLVETELKNQLSNSILEKADGIAGWPVFATQSFVSSIVPNGKMQLKSWVQNAIRDNASYFEDSIGELIDPEIASLQKDLKTEFLNPENFKSSDEGSDLSANIPAAVSDPLQGFQVPPTNICIYPHSQNGSQVASHFIGIFSKAAGPLLNPNPLPKTLAKCAGEKCSSDYPEIFAGSELIEDFLQTNVSTLQSIIQDKVNFESAKDGSKNRRLGTNKTSKFSLIKSPTIENFPHMPTPDEVYQKEVFLRSHFTFSWNQENRLLPQAEYGKDGGAPDSPIVQFLSIPTMLGNKLGSPLLNVESGEVLGELTFKARVENRYDPLSKELLGYTLQLEGTDMTLRKSKDLKPIITGAYVDLLSEEAKKFKASINIPVVKVPGMDASMLTIRVLTNEEGKPVIVLGVRGTSKKPVDFAFRLDVPLSDNSAIVNKDLNPPSSDALAP